MLKSYKPFALALALECCTWRVIQFLNTKVCKKPFNLAHLLEALTVLLWGHDSRQEQLHVADGLLHDHVKHAQQGAPLFQHLLGGRCREIPRKFTRTHASHASAHTAQTDMSTNRCRQANTAEDTNTHTDQQYVAQLKIKAIHYPVHKLHDHRG